MEYISIVSAKLLLLKLALSFTTKIKLLINLITKLGKSIE